MCKLFCINRGFVKGVYSFLVSCLYPGINHACRVGIYFPIPQDTLPISVGLLYMTFNAPSIMLRPITPVNLLLQDDAVHASFQQGKRQARLAL